MPGHARRFGFQGVIRGIEGKKGGLPSSGLPPHWKPLPQICVVSVSVVIGMQ